MCFMLVPLRFPSLPVASRSDAARTPPARARSCPLTNNSLESFHSNLKGHYLSDARRVRVDGHIHVLTRNFLPDLWERIKRILLGWEPRIVDAAEQRRRDKARTLIAERGVLDCRARFKLSGVASVLYVTSLTTPGQYYEIITAEAGALGRCSCPDCSEHRIICKHLWLAHLVFNTSIDFAAALIQARVRAAAAPPPTAIGAAQEALRQRLKAVADATVEAAERSYRAALRKREAARLSGSTKELEEQEEVWIAAQRVYDTARLSLPN